MSSMVSSCGGREGDVSMCGGMEGDGQVCVCVCVGGGGGGGGGGARNVIWKVRGKYGRVTK